MSKTNRDTTAPAGDGRSFGSRLRHSNQPYLSNRNQEAAAEVQQRRVGFLLLEHFSMMAFTAAVDALVTANLLSQPPLYRFETFGLGEASVRSDLSLNLSVDAAFDALDVNGLDMLIVCGGFRCALKPARKVVERLRELARRGVTLGGLWNGSYLLAHAGLLDNYTCTVHPDSRAGLEEAYPRVRLLPHPYVIDHDRVSCAGANSALGMMLAIIRAHHGDALVLGIEEILACDRSPDDTPDRPMPALMRNPLLPAALQAVLELMENNIEEPLSLADLARHSQVSERQIQRLFERHMRTPPSTYYLELRLTRARRLLLQTSEPITAIAIACGFAGTSHFSHCYREFFGQSPTAARRSQGRA